jgi:hypothetical protein
MLVPTLQQGSSAGITGGNRDPSNATRNSRTGTALLQVSREAVNWGAAIGIYLQFRRHMQVQNDGSMDTRAPHTPYFFDNDHIQHNYG